MGQRRSVHHITNGIIAGYIGAVEIIYLNLALFGFMPQISSPIFSMLATTPVALSTTSQMMDSSPWQS